MHYSAETQVFQVNPEDPDPSVIQKAALALREGKLVAFPTETVYGLGANALDAAAIDRIFLAKQRPANDPIIVHIHTIDQLAQLAVNVPDAAYALAEAFWPGALTLVLQRSPDVPANIAAGMQTIAVRMPSHLVAVALLKAAGLPVAAPSANTFTRPSATTAQHVLEDLQGRVDIVLDAGPTTIGLESTVLTLTDSQPVILRPGGVTLDNLRRVLPEVRLSPRFLAGEEASPSPGQMLKHYSPRAPVIVFSGERAAVLREMKQYAQQAAGQRVGVLVRTGDEHQFDEDVRVIALGYDLETISRNLFAGLRDLDAHGVDLILTYDFGREGLGAALWDRLLRAAEGHVIEIE